MFRKRVNPFTSRFPWQRRVRRKVAVVPLRRRRRRTVMRRRVARKLRIPWAVSSKPTTMMRFKDVQQSTLTIATQNTGVVATFKMNDLDTAAPIGYTALASFWNKYVVLMCSIKVTVSTSTSVSNGSPVCFIGLWPAAYGTAATTTDRNIALAQGKKLIRLVQNNLNSATSHSRPVVLRRKVNIAKLEAETDLTDDPLYEGQVAVSDPTNAPVFRVLLYPDPDDATPDNIVKIVVERVFTVQLREPKQVIN